MYTFCCTVLAIQRAGVAEEPYHASLTAARSFALPSDVAMSAAHPEA